MRSNAKPWLHISKAWRCFSFSVTQASCLRVTLNEKQRQAMVAHKQGSLCFGDIRHIDSAGLAWVLNLLRDARKHDVIFSLKNVPNELIQLARLSGVDTLLPVTKDKP